MEEKYYTPDLEEFRDGFEFESFIIVKVKNPLPPMGEDSFIREWKNQIFNFNFFDKDGISLLFKQNTQWVRVKYIDKEDIENLGWTKHLSKYTLNDMELLFAENYSETYFNCLIQSKKEKGKTDVYFYGRIKNKSELKTLMKQLDIL